MCEWELFVFLEKSPNLSPNLELRCRKTIKLFLKIWITFKASHLKNNFPRRGLIWMKDLGGVRHYVTSAKMANSHFLTLNPTWLKNKMADGVAIIIFFVCLVKMYIPTSFCDSTSKIIFCRFLSRNVKKKAQVAQLCHMLKFENRK